MAAEGMQSHDQSCGNCPTASHPATKKGRINAPILPKPARCDKSDRLLGPINVAHGRDHHPGHLRSTVMPALVAGIHVFLTYLGPREKGVDGRDEPGHDSTKRCR